MTGRKVTLEVTGSPKELVDVCKSFAIVLLGHIDVIAL